MEWPLYKFYKYMAFYITQTENFKKKLKKDYRIPHDELIKKLQDTGFLKKDD